MFLPGLHAILETVLEAAAGGLSQSVSGPPEGFTRTGVDLGKPLGMPRERDAYCSAFPPSSFQDFSAVGKVRGNPEGTQGK